MNDKEFIETSRQELLGYLKEMHSFKDQPDSRIVLRTLSGYSARASLMRMLAIKSPIQSISRFRIEEIDPFLEEVDRQFKIYSRLISANEFEWKVTTQ